MELDVAALGQAVRRRRLEQNLSQNALAHQAGVSTPTVRDLELGRGRVGVAVLLRIALALDVGIDELMREAGVEIPDAGLSDAEALLRQLDRRELGVIVRMARAMLDERTAEAAGDADQPESPGAAGAEDRGA